ncbi:MAG: PDZ domain-containing protein, partial [Ferruginibacter sp.]
LGFALSHYTAFAQEEKEIILEKSKKDKKQAEANMQLAEKKIKETQEIIIRKKGDNNTKVTVEIKGDVVTINGKPLSEFKDGDITINKRDIKIWDGQHNIALAPEDMEVYINGPLKGNIASTGKPRAFLGVTTSDDNDGNDEKKSEGAAITNVSEGSAAEKAGLKEGDIITKINDKKVEGPGSIAEVVGSFKPKDEVTVYYKRDGKEKSAKAVLGENKSNVNMTYNFSYPKGNGTLRSVPGTPMPPSAYSMPRVQGWNSDGFDQLEKLNNLKSMNGFSFFPRQQKLGLKIQDTEDGDGVKVLDTDKDSPAEKAGLKKDDIVTEIGGVKITNTDDAREQLQENAEKSAYTIKAKRNGTEMSFYIKIPKKLKTADL